ncbi:hypothetical protein D3C78_329360 [compost metagenome]
MRAVAQIAQSVEQGIENPHDSFHVTGLDSTPYKASLTMRGLFVMRLWSISGEFWSPDHRTENLRTSSQFLTVARHC